MTPSRFWEADDAATVVDGTMLGHWFEPQDVITDVIETESGRVGPRASLRYRFAVTSPDGPHVVEQQAYYETDGERISWLRIMCAGYLPADEGGLTATFPYKTDVRLVPFWGPFGVRSGTDGVTLTDDDRFVATFGWLLWRRHSPTSSGAHVTEGYRWWTSRPRAAVPRRRRLTFGTNADRGVCVHFHEKVPSRLRRSGHSALTLTVADPDALVAALTAS